MAFSRHLESYPKSLITLFERGLETEGFAVPCESRKEADRLRMCLYQIKYAITHTPNHPLHSKAAAKQLTISRNNEVIFRSPEESPLAAWGDKLLSSVKGKDSE